MLFKHLTPNTASPTDLIKRRSTWECRVTRPSRTHTTHLGCEIQLQKDHSIPPRWTTFQLVYSSGSLCAPEGTGHCAPAASQVCPCRAAGNGEFVVGKMALNHPCPRLFVQCPWRSSRAHRSGTEIYGESSWVWCPTMRKQLLPPPRHHILAPLSTCQPPSTSPPTP